MSRRTASRQGPAPPSTRGPEEQQQRRPARRSGSAGPPEDHGGHQLAPRRHHQPGAATGPPGQAVPEAAAGHDARRSRPTPAAGARASTVARREPVALGDEQDRERRHPGEEEVAHRIRRQHQPVGADVAPGPAAPPQARPGRPRGAGSSTVRAPRARTTPAAASPQNSHRQLKKCTARAPRMKQTPAPAAWPASRAARARPRWCGWYRSPASDTADRPGDGRHPAAHQAGQAEQQQPDGEAGEAQGQAPQDDRDAHDRRAVPAIHQARRRAGRTGRR